MWERWGDMQGRKGLCLKQSQVKEVLSPTMSKAHMLLVTPGPGHRQDEHEGCGHSALVSVGVRHHSLFPSNPRQRPWLHHLGEGSHGHPSSRVSQGEFLP